ncbi:hypothetical protein ABFT23_02900 [Nocardioides sp. C4-1]|uniref:hypothetical protein n=1 Tax=Nocardioides sp. C4-1 TaxID=3151851 RepID=UPI00326327C6
MKRTPQPAAPAVTLHELDHPDAVAETERVVFVTNAIRRRGGLRTRGESHGDRHRPVLAAVVR